MTVSWTETDMGIEITLSTDHTLTLVHYFITTVQPLIINMPFKWSPLSSGL